MEFGIEKCAMLVMKSGKRHLTDGMERPNSMLKILRGLHEKLWLFEFKKKMALCDLVSLFNGISTSACYLMPRPFFKKDSSGAI